MSFPVAVALDSAGNLFVADAGNKNVRRVDAVSGIITTVAGNGTWAFNGDNIPATSAAVAPTGVVLDNAGNLFIEDLHQRIRRVDATTQIITTVAGNGTQGYSGDNGPATNAQLSLWDTEGGIAFDGQGNLLFADNGNSVVRRVDALTGIITTVAGNGHAGFGGDGGPGTSATLSIPIGMALDAAGNFYFSDAFNYRVREVNTTTQTISTLLGNGTRGFRGDNGAATSAELYFLGDLALDSSGNLFLADGENRRVRRIDQATKVITTVAGNGKDESSGDNGPAVAASLPFPQGVALDSAGNLFIADEGSDRVRRVDAATGIISTVAGSGIYGFEGDNGPATNALLAGPMAVVADKSTNLFIADSGNYRVRRVDAKTGIITTIAGNGVRAYSGDNGPATSANIGLAAALALDDGGNIFIADGNNRIRRVDGVSGVITTVAGNGVAGFGGDGGLATDTSLNYPSGILVDGLGNLWISDSTNDRVRRVDAVNGVITTAAGNGTPGYSGDGGPVADAMLDYPRGIAIDGQGCLSQLRITVSGKLT